MVAGSFPQTYIKPAIFPAELLRYVWSKAPPYKVLVPMVPLPPMGNCTMLLRSVLACKMVPWFKVSVPFTANTNPLTPSRMGPSTMLPPPPPTCCVDAPRHGGLPLLQDPIVLFVSRT